MVGFQANNSYLLLRVSSTMEFHPHFLFRSLSSYGSHEVQIDSVSLPTETRLTILHSNYCIQCSPTNLTFSNHNIVLRNIGAKLEAGDKGGDAFLHRMIQEPILPLVFPFLFLNFLGIH